MPGKHKELGTRTYYAARTLLCEGKCNPQGEAVALALRQVGAEDVTEGDGRGRQSVPSDHPAVVAHRALRYTTHWATKPQSYFFSCEACGTSRRYGRASWE